MTKNKGKKASKHHDRQTKKHNGVSKSPADQNENDTNQAARPLLPLPSTSSQDTTEDGKITFQVDSCEIIATPSTSISFPGSSGSNEPQADAPLQVDILIDDINKCKISVKPEALASAIAFYDKIDSDVFSKWPRIKKQKVPAIFLHRPTDFPAHMTKVLSLGIKFYFPKFKKDNAKIMCDTNEDHKLLIKYFDKNDLPYHTFSHPAKAFIKVVLRGLPNNVNIVALKSAFRAASIPVKRVHKMHLKEAGKEKSYILAVLPLKTQATKFFKIKSIFGRQVTIEPPLSKSKQCHRCQRWGHSQRFCRGEVKCVKCAGDHLSKNCTLDRVTQPPKCVNCGGGHTASFRLCPFSPDSRVYQITQKVKKTLMQLAKPNTIHNELVTLDNWQKIFEYAEFDTKNE
ncbi:hypothetical protein evm_011657 [Chilo suppressalis]|nr:hypothetical protein evm_011657 [Chilo suppressalis]